MPRGLVVVVSLVGCILFLASALHAVDPTRQGAAPPKQLVDDSGQSTGYPIDASGFDFYGNSAADGHLMFSKEHAGKVFFVAGKRDLVMDAMAEDRMWARLDAIAWERKQGKHADRRDAQKRPPQQGKDAKKDAGRKSNAKSGSPSDKAAENESREGDARKGTVPEPPAGPTAREVREEAKRDALDREAIHARRLLAKEELGIIELTLWDGVAKEWRTAVWNDGLRAVVRDVQPGDHVVFDRFGHIVWYWTSDFDQKKGWRRWPIGGGVRKVARPAEFADPDVLTAPWWVRRDDAPSAIVAEEVAADEPVRAVRVWGFDEAVAAVEITVLHGPAQRDRQGRVKADVLIDGQLRPLIFQRPRDWVSTHLRIEGSFPKPIKYEIGARFVYTREARGAFVAPRMQLAPGLQLPILELPKSTTPIS
jgi:hypothetical protein